MTGNPFDQFDDDIRPPPGTTLDTSWKPQPAPAPRDVQLPPGLTLDTEWKPRSAPSPTPNPFDQFDPPAEKRAEPSIGSDIMQGVNHGLISGVSGLLGLPADALHWMGDQSRRAVLYGATKAGIIKQEDADQTNATLDAWDPLHELRSGAIADHLQDLARKAGIRANAPQTVAGQYAGTIASFLPGALSMGVGAAGGAAAAAPDALSGAYAAAKPMLSNALKWGVAPGVMSETAGQVTKGTEAEPYARAVGALLPMAPAALSSGMRTLDRIANPATRSLEGLTATEQQAAQQLLHQSRAAGAPLTIPEAVQHVTGNGTRMGDLQRYLEGSGAGGDMLRRFYAERPQQTEALARQTFDQIAPLIQNPYEIAPRVQGIAQGAVDEAGAARTAAVEPYYRAAAFDQVPVDRMQGILQDLDTQIANDTTGILSSKLSDLRERLTKAASEGEPGGRVPATDIDNLNRTRKYFREQIGKPSIAADAVDKETAASISKTLDDLHGAMREASPNFAAGNKLYEDITRNTVDPLMRSPVGQLSSMDKFEQQAGVLFGKNPPTGSDTSVREAMLRVRKADPAVARDFVRRHLEDAFTTASKDTALGPNQRAGGEFANLVAGKSQQAKNLEAAIRALPGGDARWDALQNTLDIFKAMRGRQGIGSQTEFNRQFGQEVSHGPLGKEVVARGASVGKWASLPYDMYVKVMHVRGGEKLARLITTGNVADLRAIASSNSRSLSAQVRLVGLLADEANEPNSRVQ